MGTVFLNYSNSRPFSTDSILQIEPVNVEALHGANKKLPVI
jgi:hypothetical protein